MTEIIAIISIIIAIISIITNIYQYKKIHTDAGNICCIATDRIPILENNSNLDNINITVNHQPIKSIIYHEYKILNKGLKPISDIQLELNIPNNVKILEYKFDESIIDIEQDNEKYYKNNKFTIPIKFLNSFKLKESCVIKIWADSSLENVEFQGRGYGWSIKYIDNTDGELLKTLSNNKFQLLLSLFPFPFSSLLLYTIFEKNK